MSDYDLRHVQPLPFPAFTTSSGGVWLRRWRLEARHVSRIALQSIAARLLGDACGLVPRVQRAGDGRFEIEVRSRVHAGSDPVMFATRRFFRQCEQWDVLIERIEDLDRGRWRAWLGEPLPVERTPVSLVTVASAAQARALLDHDTPLVSTDEHATEVATVLARQKLSVSPRFRSVVPVIEGRDVTLRQLGYGMEGWEAPMVVHLRPEVAADIDIVADDDMQNLASLPEPAAFRSLTGTLEERLLYLGAAARRADPERYAEARCRRPIHRGDVEAVIPG